MLIALLSPLCFFSSVVNFVLLFKLYWHFHVTPRTCPCRIKVGSFSELRIAITVVSSSLVLQLSTHLSRVRIIAKTDRSFSESLQPTVFSIFAIQFFCISVIKSVCCASYVIVVMTRDADTISDRVMSHQSLECSMSAHRFFTYFNYCDFVIILHLPIDLACLRLWNHVKYCQWRFWDLQFGGSRVANWPYFQLGSQNYLSESVYVSMCFFRTIKPKRLKLQSQNLPQG